MLYGQIFNLYTISGKVSDSKGSPISDVNIYIKDTYEGCVTNVLGNFILRTKISGNILLIVNHIKYIDETIQISLLKDSTVVLKEIILYENTLSGKEIVVNASSFTMADEEGQTIKKIDVLTTAGSASDIIRTIHTFPGVNQIDEGVGMYVRGGDVSETIVLLDNAVLKHPYKYESDTGGYFGTISPFLLSGTFFATGGFSAKYGNALSGVLAMETLGLPDERSLDFGIGLAAVSLGVSVPIFSNVLGLNISGNYTNTEQLFKLNNPTNDLLNNYPNSWDGNINMIYKYSRNGQIKIFAYQNHDEISMIFKYPSFSENLMNETNNSFINLYLNHLISNNIAFNTSISMNSFEQDFSLGNMSLLTNETVRSIRSNLIISKFRKTIINTGFEVNNYSTSIGGLIFKSDSTNSTGMTEFALNNISNIGGIFLEPEIELRSNIIITIGGRVDYNKINNKSTIDPRCSITYSLNPKHAIKLATGIFHQSPKPYFLNSEYGNQHLSHSKSTHIIFGYEYIKPAVNVKLELYKKKYEDLILNNEKTNYSNDGYGYAYGLDVFLKSDVSFFSGWLSYSYLRAERSEFEFSKLVPTNYDIRHSFSCIAKLNITSNNLFSTTYNYNSGRPFTPIHSEWNSGRLPPIKKLDITFSHLSYTKFGLLVSYFGLANVFDRKNIYGYRSSVDNSEMTEIRSIFGRNIYFGISINIK